MGRVNKCCNPLNKKNHKYVIKNLVLITANRACEFKDFIGYYMCNSCERAIYLGRKPGKPENSAKSPVNNNVSIDVTDPEVDEIEDNIKKDPTFKCDIVDNQLKISNVNKLLLEVGEPPIKLRRVSSVSECKKAILTSVKKVSGTDFNNNNANEVLLNNFKSAFNQTNSRSEKIKVLTTLPLDWSIKMIRREFKVSKRMVQAAKNIRKKSGFASQPGTKKGKSLDNSTLDRVKNFYLSDDISRVMPGMKDYVTVSEDGKKVQKQKRLLLFNIHDLYKKFKEAFPEEKIGQTKFQTLRPRECISAGKSGTHNVCVCKIHQNAKLQLHGLKNELKKKGIDFPESLTDLIQSSVCVQPTSSCFFSTCKKCPEVDYVINKLKLLIDSHEIKEITFSQWKSTDRTEIVEATYTKEDFLSELKNKWSELLKHDFVAKSQASFFSNQKESAEAGEFIVCLDFSENYSFFIQDAIQSHHWSNDQATLHPYVAYYTENGEIKHENLVVVSEKVNHDASSVHLFNAKLIEFLKNKFGAENVKKIKYFSDGAASQYKNKYNFANLINHLNDFGVKVEWNFFATSHGKGACDGLAGSVKRQAFRASLQRDKNNHITTPRSFFQWAESSFKKVHFAFCSQKDHELHEQKYQERFQRAITIKNTRQFHYFKPLDDVLLECKLVSDDEKVFTNRVFKKK